MSTTNAALAVLRSATGVGLARGVVFHRRAIAAAASAAASASASSSSAALGSDGGGGGGGDGNGGEAPAVGSPHLYPGGGGGGGAHSGTFPLRRPYEGFGDGVVGVRGSGRRGRCFSSSSSSSSSSSNIPDRKSEGGDVPAAGSKTSSDGVVAVPIDFDVASKVEGNESQIVTVAIEPGQVLRAESGAMMFMTDGVSMNTTTGGGLSSGFKRFLTGQNVFISDYTYNGQPGTAGLVALGTDFPSKIVRLSVDQYGGKIVAQQGALLCASHTIDIEMEFTKKFSTGFFGGEGFVLQALTGEGDVFLKAGGTLIRRELRNGEPLRIASGSLVAFSNGVDFDIQMMPGFKNVLFGGEGLFVTTLTGPGTVWLQGQPPQRMISEIARRVPSGIGLAVPIGGMGGGGGSDGNGGEGGGNGGEGQA